MAARRPKRALSGAPIAEEELRRIVARLARGGNMPACRFYAERWLDGLDETPAEDDPLAEVDELARRRRSA